MFDFECQMRFWKCATEAAFGYASATMAAVTVMQDHVHDQIGGEDRQRAPAPFSFDAFSPFVSPFQWWTPPQPASPFMPFMGGGFPDFARMFFPAAPAQSPMMQAWNPFALAAAGPFPDFSQFFANPFFNSPWHTQWAGMMRSYGWPVPEPSWMMWQHPMTAALMSAGMPYSVASPTARANASAMDAADAARDGFNKAFSSYHSDGRHAAARTTPIPDLMSLMMAPWLAFAETQPPIV